MASVCEEYQRLAAKAVDEWDGQDNSELLVLLARHLGMTRDELKDDAYAACGQIEEDGE